jgi:hypothetical protein
MVKYGLVIIRQPPSKRQVAGSSPAGVASLNVNQINLLVGPDPLVNELGRLVGALSVDASPASRVPVSAPTGAALMLTLRMGFHALFARMACCRSRWRRAFDHRHDIEDERGTAGVAFAARRC